MEPLKITAHMMSGVAMNLAEGLSLDGPLLWAVVLDRHGDDALRASPSAAEIEEETATPDPNMPLAVHGDPAGTWCYAVSHADLVGHVGSDVVYWHKRFDDAMAAVALERGALDMGRRRTIQTGSGEFRAYRMPLYLEVVERLEWYAIGDAAGIHDLLERHIRHLGKKHARGHGAVIAWDVEPWSGPRDRWLWSEPGVPARPTPLALINDWPGETVYAAFRPPAWVPNNQAVCAAVREAARKRQDQERAERAGLVLPGEGGRIIAPGEEGREL